MRPNLINYVKEWEKFIREITNYKEMTDNDLVVDAKALLEVIAKRHEDIANMKKQIKEFGEKYIITREALVELSKIDKNVWVIPEVTDFNKPDKFPEIITPEEKEAIAKEV